jgi:hypothetical protein
MSKSLSVLSQLKITLITCAIFFLLSLNFIYKITSWFFKLFNINTLSETKCPNIKGILVHTVIFAIIIIVMMNIKVIEKYDGIANPEGMLKYNTAYLEAQNADCSQCVNACEICMNDPYSEDCKRAIKTCENTCRNIGVVMAVKDAHNSSFENEYSHPGSCI